MKAVTLFRVIPLVLSLVLTLCNISLAATAADEPEVKLSASGICHDQTSTSFKRTKKFEAYDSIATCIAQGGRLPKAKTKSIDKATKEAIEQGRAFVTLYDRGDWPHWLDSDKDCQNTRHELLLQTSTKPVYFKSDKQCNVLAGEWYDPYSNEIFTISKDLDLDHIVPLKFAHGHGGSNWSREQKAIFANDLDNLILAQASLNRQKGAKGINDWLPPNHQYRCEYIAHFNKVMNKYNLTYIASEQRVVNRLVKACS
ncbi:HNH endonuclease family protein [Paraglaciecola sp. L3A3]|uniref:HNH endonuclease family protein n=1 Tax=Paraglaciecola sp. L3A3 TaxID=2686358 RepID=UPI00131B401B|nr:HNH endonuclease family protein [Paraglaciecola sp. L3A3]